MVSALPKDRHARGVFPGAASSSHRKNMRTLPPETKRDIQPISICVRDMIMAVSHPASHVLPVHTRRPLRLDASDESTESGRPWSCPPSPPLPTHRYYSG